MRKPTSGTIAVIGLGYVGLPLAFLAEKKGWRAIGIDINPEKVALLNEKKAPMADPAITRELASSRLEATNDFSRVRDAEIIAICVPTPVYPNHKPNLEPVASAAAGLAPHLQRGQLVILESTVNPGISEEILRPILERGSGLAAGTDFSLAHCPERINPGDPHWHVGNIPRVVGGIDQKSLERTVAFYRALVDAEVKPMGSLREAEAVKIVENAFRDINIAFVNELAMSFAHLGIDVMKVIDGASTKPFAFMAHYPGCGVGGHCIPVDPYYLITYAHENGFNHRLLAVAREVNERMPDFTIRQLSGALGERGVTLERARIGILGLAYKPEIDDCRESPSLEILKRLRAAGAETACYDPYVRRLSTAASLDAAVRGSHGVIVATAHRMFRELTPEFFIERNVPVVVDGRNCLPKEAFTAAGITYRGIGR